MREATFRNVHADRFFLLAYSAFLAVSSFLVARMRRKPWGWIGVSLAVIAAVYDTLENQQLLYILMKPDTEWGPFLFRLSIFTWIKWGAITAAFLFLGWSFKDLNRFGLFFDTGHTHCGNCVDCSLYSLPVGNFFYPDRAAFFASFPFSGDLFQIDAIFFSKMASLRFSSKRWRLY
ncbi:MAG: hypothetical protein IPJ40_03585 [Saprospirales bacterium]|nr:hypothetical protein [Saprospirales bacterium]